jgi:hypothetical protein
MSFCLTGRPFEARAGARGRRTHEATRDAGAIKYSDPLFLSVLVYFRYRRIKNGEGEKLTCNCCNMPIISFIYLEYVLEYVFLYAY